MVSLSLDPSFARASSNMLTGGAIAPAVEQIAPPVTDIYPPPPVKGWNLIKIVFSGNLSCNVFVLRLVDTKQIAYLFDKSDGKVGR